MNRRHGDPEPRVRTYSWLETISLTERLADLIKVSFMPTAVIAVLRGGAFPAWVIAHRLGVRTMYAVQVTTTRTEEVRSARRPPTVQAPSEWHVSGGKLLVVDDVVNTGQTLRSVLHEINRRGRPARVATACIAWDSVSANDSAVQTGCPSDYHADRVEAWVRFPWEAPQS